METNAEIKHYELIIVATSSGNTDIAVKAAKEAGVRGGTVLRAREAELGKKIFGITVQPEKEMVMILVPREIKDDILHALYRSVGLKTPAQGIAFSLPVDSVVGLSAPNAAEDHAREE